MDDDENNLLILRDYVSAMIDSGYDALELEAFAKKFKGIDYVRLLPRLGCEVIEDLVLLRLNQDYDDEDTFF